MNAIEKGQELASGLMWETEQAYMRHVIEQTAKAYAVEELQKVSKMLWEKNEYEMDVPGNRVSTLDADEWILSRIKELKEGGE